MAALPTTGLLRGLLTSLSGAPRMVLVDLVYALWISVNVRLAAHILMLHPTISRSKPMLKSEKKVNFVDFVDQINVNFNCDVKPAFEPD